VPKRENNVLQRAMKLNSALAGRSHLAFKGHVLKVNPVQDSDKQRALVKIKNKLLYCIKRGKFFLTGEKLLASQERLCSM